MEPNEFLPVLDAPIETQAGAGFRAMRAWAKDQGLTVREVLEQAFAGDMNRLRQDNATLQEGVRAVYAEMQALQHDHAQQMTRQGQGFEGLLRAAWSYPQTRLLTLHAVILARLWCFLAWENNHAMPVFTLACNGACGVLLLLLFHQWSGQQYEHSGITPVVLRVAAMLALIPVALFCFFGFVDWRHWFISADGMDAAIGFALLFLLLAVTVTNGAERLGQMMTRSGGSPLGTLRRWFA